MKLKRTGKLLALVLALVMVFGLLPMTAAAEGDVSSGTVPTDTHTEELEEYTVTFKSSIIGNTGKLVLKQLDLENSEEIILEGGFSAGNTATLAAGKYSYEGYNNAGDVYYGGGTLEIRESGTIMLQRLTIYLDFKLSDMVEPPVFSELGANLAYIISKENDLDESLISGSLEYNDTHADFSLRYSILVANGGTEDPTEITISYATESNRVTSEPIIHTSNSASSKTYHIVINPASSEQLYDSSIPKVTFISSGIGNSGRLVLKPLDNENANEIILEDGFSNGKTIRIPAGMYSYKGYQKNDSTEQYLGGGTVEISPSKTTIQFQLINLFVQVDLSEMVNPPKFSELNGMLKYEIDCENDLEVYCKTTKTPEELDELTSFSLSYNVLVANDGTSDSPTINLYYETSDPRVSCTSYTLVCNGNNLKQGFINVLPSTPRTIRVPTEYKNVFYVYHKGSAHYYPFEELTPSSVTDREDGFTDFLYYMPAAYSFHYLLDGDEEHIRIGRVYSYTMDQTQDSFTVHGYSKTDGDGGENFDLDNQLRLSNNGSEEDNLYLSVPDNNYLVLDSGSDERIEAYRVWEAITDTTGNYFIEPNFHYEVIGDSVSVTEAGAEGREYAVIHAAGSGISVVKVTYDAMCWENGNVDAPENDYSTKYYNAIDPVNTRVVIVRVGGPNATAIDTGITQREYDTIYFDAGKADHADFTFIPAAADGSALSVRVHDPLHNTEWGSAWTDYEANADGSFTVHLKDGRNIIEISAPDGSVEYYVVNCRALQVNIENLTRPEAEDWMVGDTITVSFDGLSLPLQKMAAVYNPNFGSGGGWVEYSSSLGQTFRSESVQYNIQTKNSIQFTLTEPGVYMLANGQIHGTHFGEPLDYHRSIPSGGKTPMLNAPEFNDGYFSTLPDLVFDVRDENETGDAYDATMLIPDGVTLTVRNSLGYHMEPDSTSDNAYTYSLDNFEGDAEKATYTWILEKEGCEAQAGTFVIEDHDITLDLTDVILQPIQQTEGEASVRLVGYDRMLRMSTTVEVDNTHAEDLAAQGYVLYNHGGYTVLHALIEAGTSGNDKRFTCQNGVFVPNCTLPDGVSGQWICEVNGAVCTDPANALLNAGDKVEFYFLSDDEACHAWFTEETGSMEKGQTLTLTLMGAESGAAAGPLSNVPVFVGEIQVGETDSNGQIVIPGFGSYRSYRISAGGIHGGTASYALYWLHVTKPETSAGSGSTTVTFRLIGDVQHEGNDSAHEYVTWVPTTTYTFNGTDVTVGQVFAKAMSEAGLTYTGLSSNYIDSITAPDDQGGYVLSEMDNAQLSGWMYTVNGIHSGAGLNSIKVADGDEIVWHYVDDPVEETFDWNTGCTGDSTQWDTWYDAADRSSDNAAAVVSIGGAEIEYADNAFTATLPEGSVYPTAEQISVTPEDKAAVVSALTGPETDEEGETWTFSVTAEDGTTVNYTLVVATLEGTVVPVTGVTLSETQTSVVVGKTLTLTATVEPEDATDPTVTWLSSDESIATVEDGVVTGVKAGTATITAQAGDMTASCVVTVTAPAPAAPENVEAAAAAGKITVSFDAVEGAAKYLIQRRSYDGSAWSSYATLKTLTGTSYVDAAVTAGSRYQYRVRAYNGSAWGKFGTAAAVTVPAPAPAAPVISAAAEDGKVTVQWAAVDNATKYAVYRRAYVGGAWESAWTQFTATEAGYADGSVTASTKYQYRVRAYGPGGWSGFSNALTVTTPAAAPTVPAAPTGVTAATANGSKVVTLSWDAVEGADSFVIYRRAYNNETASWGGWEQFTSSTNGYVDEGADYGTIYKYRVKARNVVGLSKTFSEDATAKTPPATPTISDVKVETGKVTVSWSAESGATRYQVFRREREGSRWGAMTRLITTTETSYVDTTAEAGTVYQYLVKSYNGGYSSYSAGKQITAK